MAKLDFRKIRNEYIRRSMRYANGVSMLYDQALSDIAREFALVDYNPDIVFSFSNYGKFGRVDSIMSRLEEQIQSVINVGIENEFGKAYAAHNDLLKQVLGDNITTELERAFAPRITSGNAAKLFISETESNNITRSMRVWNGATLGQMETAVQEAMMEGVPAQQMAGLIEQYLNDPESCFRRFRIKTGVDADGKSMYGRKWMKRVRNEDGSTSWFDADPRDYPTGQGVYHSSYKNALRYCRNTTNIAYRTADYERYQTEPFVLGIEIRTTSNPAHKEDICDLLAGRYPLDFKWVQWHVNCMCYEIPILATPDEVNAMADAIMEGRDPSTVPVAGRLTDVPDNFKEWVANNQDRIQDTINKGKQLPYFLRDNQQYVNIENKSFENNVLVKNNLVDVIRHSEQSNIARYAETSATYPTISTPTFSFMPRVADPSGRLAAERHNIEILFGDKYNAYIEESIRLGKAPSDILADLHNKHITGFEADIVRGSIEHLDFLRSFDTSKIFEPWKNTFDSLVTQINSYDYSKGLVGIFNEIEHAHNIAILSTNKRAITYGLQFLSDKTPATIFTSELWGKSSDIINTIPSKIFFDKLQRFVPLFNDSAGITAYYPQYRFVNIVQDDRLHADWFRKAVFHHEYGHAMGDINGYNANRILKNRWQIIKNDILRTKGNDIVESTKRWYADTYGVEIDGYAKIFSITDRRAIKDLSETQVSDIEREQLGSLSDIFCAALKKKGAPENTLTNIAHFDNYFDSTDSQLHEFLAHSMECYWSGNDTLAKIYPDAYRLMISLVKKLMF